jgi:hypothetical protein
VQRNRIVYRGRSGSREVVTRIPDRGVDHWRLADRVSLWPIERLIAYARNPLKNDAAVDRMAA